MNIRTNLSLSAVTGLLVIAAGCATQPMNRMTSTGDPILDAQAALKTAPINDQVLWQYRLGTLCLRAGRTEEAKSYFDDALSRINGIMGRDKTAAAARNVFKAEAKKTFIGEPYERVMANFYRGVLYWKDGEIDNARACFINAQFQDSDAGLVALEAVKGDIAAAKEEAEKYSSDYVLFDYLDGWIRTAQGGDGSDAFHRAAALAGNRALPPFDGKARVVVFAEYGQGPTKFASGEHNQELHFQPGPTNITSARLKVAGQTHELAPFDDINFQATTRGGRVMDHVLKNKAVFKDTTGTIGNVALATGAGMAMTTSYTGQAGGYVALGSMMVGLLGTALSSVANPAADVRCWDNLPAYISFAAITLPAGSHPATVEFLDTTGAVAATRNLTVDVREGASDAVVFVSDRMP